MMIKVWVEQEVDAEVPLADIMAELPGLGRPTSDAEVKQLLSRCVACIRLVPDDILNGLSADARQMVARVMREQADRYAPAGVEVTT